MFDISIKKAKTNFGVKHIFIKTVQQLSRIQHKTNKTNKNMNKKQQTKQNSLAASPPLLEKNKGVAKSFGNQVFLVFCVLFVVFLFFLWNACLSSPLSYCIVHTDSYLLRAWLKENTGPLTVTALLLRVFAWALASATLQFLSKDMLSSSLPLLYCLLTCTNCYGSRQNCPK